MRPSHEPRVLVSSLRSLNAQVANVALYEFEQVIGRVDEARIVASRPMAGRIERLLRSSVRLSGIVRNADRLVPFATQHVVDRDYDLLFLVCDNFWQALSIGTIRNWRERCARKVCYIAELWEPAIRRHAKYLKFLRSFDHVFVSTEHAARMMQEIAGVPCSYLPPGTDALAFSPDDNAAARHIFVSNIGRRDPAVHRALLDGCARRGRFYFFDTMVNFRVERPSEHRGLMSSLIKESRFFLANYAKMDRPAETGGHQEIGYRFFEGAAAGAVLVGRAPDTETWHRLFDWPDAVIALPDHAADIPACLDDLDGQPDRLLRIRRDNVVNSLLRHDWVYRWEQVLAAAGLPITTGMIERKQRLAEKARLVRERPAGSGNADIADRAMDAPLQEAAGLGQVTRLPVSSGGRS